MSDERQQSDEEFARLFQALRADEDPNQAYADALFARLEDEATPHRRPGGTWVLLAAAVLVASLATGAVFGSGLVRVPWLIADADGSPEPTATAPEPAPTRFVARVAAAGLMLRVAPGLSAESLGSFSGGELGLVVQGPVVADGYDWYQFSALGLPPNTGCAFPVHEEPLLCPTWFGWVAGASPEGDRWIEPASLDCPDSPMNMRELALGRGNMERLACNPDRTVTVRGWWPKEGDIRRGGGYCPSGPPAGWLYCQNYNYVFMSERENAEGVGLNVIIDPLSGITMPERGQWIEIVGHFDDPAAQDCDENSALPGGGLEDPDQAVLLCRARLVVDSVRPVSGPF